jgi:type IV pilus assembly protein PilV
MQLRAAATMNPASITRQSGVTLIEVMVAVLVLSIGLLGVAATLAKSARFSMGAWAQSAVANGLSDVAERMRSTPNAPAASFTLVETYANQRSALGAGTVAAAKDCNTTACTPAETSQFHLANWQLGLDRSMPGAAGWVSPLSSAATESKATSYEVAVLWFDKSNIASDDTLNAALVCTGTEAGIDQRRCCPAAAAAPDGVRCTRMVLVP